MKEIVKETGKKQVKVCSVPAPGEWNKAALNSCEHKLAKISVSANGSGKWPIGFSWTIMKDGKHSYNF